MNRVDLLGAPLLVSWQITRDCDLCCLHCCTESAPGKPAEDPNWVGVRDWSVGQAVQLRAAMERLTWRAKKDTWPEYSELSCMACHHSLVPAKDSWRQERGFGERTPGSAPWGTWYYSMPRMLAGPTFANAPEVVTSLAQLEKLMQRPYPEPEAVLKEARQAAGRMVELLGKLGKSSYGAYLRRIADESGPPA